MRILYVAPNILVPGTNGGSTHVTEVSRALRRFGEVLVLARRGSHGPGVVPLGFGNPPVLRRLLPYLYYPTALRLAREFRPDVIYERFSALGLGALLKRALGVPMVTAVLDYSLSPLSLRLADRLVATVPAIVPEAGRHKTVRVSWGANVEHFRPDVDGAAVRRRLGLEGREVVGYTGAFYHWHGLDRLVEVVGRLDRPGLRVLMVGDGEERGRVEARVRAAGLAGRFVFTGRVPYAEVPAYVAACDVCLAAYEPERHEATRRLGTLVFDPLKIFEYLAAERPVIVSRSANLEELFADGEHVKMVRAGDARDLAEAIRGLLDDPEGARRMARRGRERVLERFTWQRHAEQLHGLFAELIAADAGASAAAAGAGADGGAAGASPAGDAGRGNPPPRDGGAGKERGEGRWRSGGCLIAVVALILALAVTALVYRPPRPLASGSMAAADAGPAAVVVASSRGTVRAVALSPDGTLAASGGEGAVNGRHAIELRRIRDGRFEDRETPFRTLDGHDGPVTGLRFLPDGSALLSIGLDGRLRRWRLEDGALAASVEPPAPAAQDAPGGLLALAVSPDGRRVAAGGWPGEVRVWDLAALDREPLRFEPMRGLDDLPKDAPAAGHLEEVRGLVFPPDAPELLFSAGGEGLIVAWNLAERRAGRVVSFDGVTPKVTQVRLRSAKDGWDREGAAMALVEAPGGGGVLVSDYRSCVYRADLTGPCRGWWAGTELPAGSACLRPLLDRKAFCAGLDRPVTGPAVAFLAIVPFPGIDGGFAGIASSHTFRVLRKGDSMPWREFEGAVSWGDQFLCAAPAAAPIVLTGSRAGRLAIYRFEGGAVSPGVVLSDQLL
mgnify:CR=1 FL=1